MRNKHKKLDFGLKFRPKMKVFQGNSKASLGESIELQVIKAKMFLDPILYEQSALRVGRKCVICIKKHNSTVDLKSGLNESFSG